MVDYRRDWPRATFEPVIKKATIRHTNSDHTSTFHSSTAQVQEYTAAAGVTQCPRTYLVLKHGTEGITEVLISISGILLIAVLGLQPVYRIDRVIILDPHVYLQLRISRCSLILARFLPLPSSSFVSGFNGVSLKVFITVQWLNPLSSLHTPGSVATCDFVSPIDSNSTRLELLLITFSLSYSNDPIWWNHIILTIPEARIIEENASWARTIVAWTSVGEDPWSCVSGTSWYDRECLWSSLTRLQLIFF